MSIDFISGTYFKKRCKYSVGQYDDARSPRFTFDVDESLDNRLVFVKAEYINQLSWNVNQGHITLPEDFILLTHNSDMNITGNIGGQVLSWFPTMSRWYAQNLSCVHDKISPLPIGIANPKWSHGNVGRFRRLFQEDNKKDNLLYVNFNIATNRAERMYCLSKIGHPLETKYPDYSILADHDNFVNSTQDDYLRDISKSYFVISPNGNGIDCHKTWESIYMGSVPIVTQSVMAERFRDMGIPLLIIDRWDDFEYLDLNEVLFENIWNGFKPKNLDFKFFIGDQ